MKELTTDLCERLKSFLNRNLSSSICVHSKTVGLAERVVTDVVKDLTRDYLMLADVGIDEIRAMIDFLTVSTADEMKIVTIFQAEKMLQESANALLKTLEEPPTKSIIVLVTTRYYDLLPTIRSRVKIFNLSIPAEYYEKLSKEVRGMSKSEQLLRLAKNDFDVFEYLLKQGPVVLEGEGFDPDRFLKLFSEEKLSAQQKIELLYLVDNLFDLLSSNGDRFLVEIYSQIQAKSDKVNMTNLVIESCRFFQLSVESRKIFDPQLTSFLDSILTNKLRNFNSELALINMLILVKRAGRR